MKNAFLLFAKIIGLFALIVITLFVLFLAQRIAEHAQQKGFGIVHKERPVVDERNGQTTTDPYEGELTGTMTCLPLVDMATSSTEECKMALETDAHDFYALDYHMLATIEPEFIQGKVITAYGIITPIENLNSDMWQKYRAKGIFTLKELR